MLAALGVWLSSATAVALPPEEGLLGLLLSRPRPWVLAAAAALALTGIVRRSFGPAVAPLVVAGVPLVAPWVPAAWIWAGDGAVVLWIFWAGGTVSAGWRHTALPIAPGWHAAAAVALAIAWLGGIAAGVGPYAMSGDAPHYLTITQSLLDDGDVDLKNNYDARTHRTFYQGSLEPRHTNTSPWGEHYSFHGPGVAVLVAPGMALYGAAGATASLVLLMAFGSGVLWHAAWEITRSSGAAWFGWAALVASAPYALHAAAIYPDGPAAVAVAGPLWLLARLQRRTALPLWEFALGSVGLAALPWLHVRLALPAILLGSAILWTVLKHQPDRWTRAGRFLMIPVISAAGWFASAYVMFGTWNPARAMLQRTAPGSWDAAPAGLLGLLADQEHGLFPAAPVMLAAIAAYPRFARAFPLIGACTGGVVLGVLAMSSLWVWWGGDAAPARFLTVVLPACALWLALFWQRAGTPGRRALSLALTLSAALTVLFATADGGARAYNFPDGRGSIFEALSDSVDISQALPSLHRTGATASSELPLALVWLAAVALATVAVRAIPASRSEGTAWAAGGLVVMAAAAASATAGWHVRGVAGWTPASAAHTLLQALSRPDVLATAGGWPASRLAPARLAGRLRVATPESVTVDPGVLLHVPNVPAGDYRLRARGRHADTAGTELSLALGRDAWPFAVWPLGSRPPTITLLTAVHSVRVSGAADADVWLQPLALRQPAAPAEARRVTRMGRLVVYSMDDDSYVESMGAWTGGNRTTEFLVSSPQPALVAARLEAGPVAVDVRLKGRWGERTLRLEPHASSLVTLHTATALAPIDLRATVQGGFPASLLSGPSDSRTLGVWISFEATPPS